MDTLLKKITNAKEQKDLIEICRSADPGVNRKTGLRCLLDLAIKLLPYYAEKNESPIPLLEMMHKVVPRFGKDSLQTDIFKLFRKAIKKIYPEGHKAIDNQPSIILMISLVWLIGG
jgi:hypothetical protein